MNRVLSLASLISLIFLFSISLLLTPAETYSRKDDDSASVNCGDSAKPLGVQVKACINTAGETIFGKTPKSLQETIAWIIRGLLTFLGITFLVLIIYGGIMWMTAGGNEEKVTKAKSILANAALGLGIVFIAWSLSLFIFETLISATST